MTKREPATVDVPADILPERIRLATVVDDGGRYWVAVGWGETVALMTPEHAAELADRLTAEAAYAATAGGPVS